jgi:hypothetical protein
MDLYSSALTQRPEELSGSATPPPPKTAITERQVLGQIRAERVVPKSQAPLSSAPSPQTETLGQAGDGGTPELAKQPQVAPQPEAQHQPALENPEQPQPTSEKQEKPQPAPEQQVLKSAKVVGTTKEPTGSARLGEKAKSSALAMEEILRHYEEENRFCGTHSYTMEILVGDEVEAIEAVGKIFLEEVKVSLSQLYNMLLYNS